MFSGKLPLFVVLTALAATAADESALKQLLVDGNNRFTAKLFSEVVAEKPLESVVVSAFSTLPPLAQLALASVGESHDELLGAIGLKDDNTTKDVISVVNSRLRSVKGINLNMANRIYIQENLELNQDFAKLSRDVFQSQVKRVDFMDNVGTAQDINLWVEGHTNHRIKNLVNPDLFNAGTNAVLVNALYFKGNWSQKFNPLNTADRDFHVNKETTITVPTMYQRGYFKYGDSQELNAKLLEMFYEGYEASFLVVLPNEVDGLAALAEKLQDPAALTRAIENMYMTDVDVHLPKFKIETTTDLKTVLKKIGITKLFSAGKARLDHLLKVPSDLFVSTAIQKASIEVNEEGATATAANVYVPAGATPHGDYIPRVLKFRADRPFYIEVKVSDSAVSPASVLYQPGRASLRLFTGTYAGCSAPPRASGH